MTNATADKSDFGKMFWPASMLVVFITILISVVTKRAGIIGFDSDDMMRLVQVRDLYAGQDWFDLTQYRMGKDSTLMHWSRLIDAPIVALIAFFDVFFSYETAEKIAITIWPPLTSIIVLAACYIMALNLRGKAAAKWAFAFAAFYVIIAYRFQPGSLDHHNVQMGLICLAPALLMSPVSKSKSFLLAGAVVALSISIGADIYVFAALICAIMAMLWAVKGDTYRRPAINFGVGLAAMQALLFVLLTAPKNYGVIHCDGLSVLSPIATAAGGGGLALCAFLFSGKKTSVRFGALIGLGIACLAIISAVAPACLSNPLGELPEIVKTLWLAEIDEAEPLLKDRPNAIALALIWVGSALIAFYAALVRIRRGQGANFVIISVLLFAALSLSLYQIRYVAFAPIFAIPVLSVLFRDLLTGKDNNGQKNLLYIPALAAALPPLWYIPIILFPAPETNAISEAKENSKACYSENVMDYVETLPIGRWAAPGNGTPFFLMHTSHRALSGNYHRNAKGIDAELKIFLTEPETAKQILTENDVSYLLHCEHAFKSGLKRNNNPLVLQLHNGEIPDYLEPIKTFEEEAVTLFKVASP